MARRNQAGGRFGPGDRVEVHPRFDLWMRGDRYGTVVKDSKLGVYVTMDKSGKRLRYARYDLTLLERGANPGRGKRYSHQRLRRPSRFVPGSFRLTKKRKGVRVVVGKLKGERRRVRRGKRRGKPVLTAQAVLRRKRRNPPQPGEGPGQNIRNALASLVAERELIKQGMGERDPAELYKWYGDIVTRLEVALRQVESGRLGNPTLAVFGNPSKAAVLSNDVQAVLYRHAADGRDYVHPFGHGVRVVNNRDGSTVVRAATSARSGVRATLLRDGSVLLRHPSKPLWKEF